jgi:hypothetical protein
MDNSSFVTPGLTLRFCFETRFYAATDTGEKARGRGKLGKRLKERGNPIFHSSFFIGGFNLEVQPLLFECCTENNAEGVQ